MGESKKIVPGQYKPEDSVGYLLSRARLKLAKSLDVALAEWDITHAQGGIVLMLASGKYSTAADLAREMYIDSASMTRMVDRLEKRGLISRVRKSGDRRVIDLVLTPDGQKLGRRLPSVYAAVVNSNFAGFSPDEMATLKSLLRKSLGCDSNSCDADAGGN